MLLAKPKATADNTYGGLDYSGYHKNQNYLIIVLLYIVLKKTKIFTAFYGTQFDIALGKRNID